MHPPTAQLVSIGPFRAVVPSRGEPGAWVTIVEGPVAERATRAAVARLRSIFDQNHATLEIEYDEVLFPEAARSLLGAGLTLAERNPLMACRPDRFVPHRSEGVVLRRLTPASRTADIEAFQAIRWDGDDGDRARPSAEQLKKELATTSSVYLLARLDRGPAGTGVSHGLNAVAEIVGVVTRPDRRRRGVAATTTSDLLTRHFSGGGDFAFLDAANEAAARIYERLGFTRFGANAIYR